MKHRKKCICYRCRPELYLISISEIVALSFAFLLFIWILFNGSARFQSKLPTDYDKAPCSLIAPSIFGTYLKVQSELLFRERELLRQFPIKFQPKINGDVTWRASAGQSS